MKNVLTLLICCGVIFSTRAQCMMYELSLPDRVNEATAIVEGKVIDQISFWNVDQTYIHTASLVLVYKVFKGSITSDTIEIVTEGGAVGDKMHKVEPSVHLAINDFGIFCLKNTAVTNSSYNIPNDQKFEVIASEQGFIRFDDEHENATDVFHSYSDIEVQLYEEIETIVGSAYSENLIWIFTGGLPIEGSPNITSFSPNPITAGTFSVLTINGSGFGNSYTNNADVQFKDADDGGASWFSAPANHILSWSNTQITVQVPFGAGTGTIRVKDSGGSSGTSSGTLTITYSETNILNSGTYYQPDLVDMNNSGGLTFVYNSGFDSNAPAVEAFERALDEWRCNTFVNFYRSGTTSTDCNSDDDINVVTFDGACTLPNGVLATTYTYFFICGGSNVWVEEIDLKFDVAPSGGWNFGPGPTNNGKYDFESVAVHELGHAHELGHVISTLQVMHYSIATNTDNRDLDPASDVAGGNDVMSRSVIDNSCGPGGMDLVDAAACAVASPIANFSATPLSGCAPLTVTFTDLSAENPTSWQWDIDNNGTTDYTTQNPTHIYSTNGSYSIKLIATNSSGTDTRIKNNYVNVQAVPNANAGNDETICDNENVLLTATGGGTYSWSNGSNQQSINVSPNVTTTYTVTVTSSQGCADTDEVTVNVNSSPTVDAGNDTTVCEGTYVMLVATGNGTSYEWSTGQTADSIVINALTSANYTVTATAANGCTDTDVVAVNVFPPTDPNLGNDQTICDGDLIILTASGGVTYYWNTGETTSSISVSPSADSVYNVAITDANGCYGYDEIIISVIPNPVVSFNYIITGNSVQFDDPSGTDVFWSWNFDDGSGATTQSPVHVFAQNGTYNVCMIAGNNFGCEDDTCMNITITGVGIDEIGASEILIYPNPFDQSAVISVQSAVEKNMELKVFDMLGKEIYWTFFSDHCLLQTENWSSGSYLVRIVSDDQVFHRRINKQ